MGDTALHALFAGEGAATSLFASLALKTAVLISIAFAVLTVKTSVGSDGPVGVVERVVARTRDGVATGGMTHACILRVGLRCASVGVCWHFNLPYITFTEGWTPACSQSEGRLPTAVPATSVRE